MNWTKELPKETGYYWWIDQRYPSEIEMVHLNMNIWDKEPSYPESYYIRFMGDEQESSLKGRVGDWWMGPIIKKPEPPKEDKT